MMPFRPWALAIFLAACSNDSTPFRVARDASSSGGASGAVDGATSSGGSGPMGGTPGDGGGESSAASRPDGGGATLPGARSFKLASSGAQLLVSGQDLGLQLTDANLASDADVFAVHQEFYGVPWRELEAGASPPAEWTARMQSLAAAARAAKRPVFLSVTMLNGTRERLAATTTIDAGQVQTDDSTSASCYDFATATDGASKRDAYLRYVQLMVDTFSPAYLNVAVEVNLFFEKCPAASPALREVANAAYDAAKARRPDAVVFPSIQIDHLYGYSKDSCPDQTDRDACFDAAYAALSGLKRDRFAMSSYPYLSGISDPATIPADWFTRAAARGKETPLVAETGWLSTPLVAKTKDGTCSKVMDQSNAHAAAYLTRVLTDAERGGLDLVTWWSDRDLLLESVMSDCPCHLDATWCSVVDVFRGAAAPGSTDTQFLGEVLMKAFGSMGLRLYDGSPKPLVYPVWAAARARPLRAP